MSSLRGMKGTMTNGEARLASGLPPGDVTGLMLTNNSEHHYVALHYDALLYTTKAIFTPTQKSEN